MIYYLVTRAHGDTIGTHLQTWGRRLRTAVAVVPYDRLAFYRRLPRGTYLFTDLERLTDAGLALAELAWAALADGGGSTLLNDPHRALRREPLLRALHAAGRNPFAVHRAATVDPAAVRYPAFVRRASEHDGSLTPLLRGPAELRPAVAALVAAGAPADDLLAVEFCDTADATGTVRKFSAMRVGDRLLPRHLFLGTDWVLKHADRVDPAAVAEEAAYLGANPHAAELDAVFRLAGIDYGRVDYALLGGRAVTWEIKTNPVLTVEPADLAPPRLAGQAAFNAAYGAAMAELSARQAGGSVPLAVPRSLLTAPGHSHLGRRRRRVERAVLAMTRTPPWRQLLAAADGPV